MSSSGQAAQPKSKISDFGLFEDICILKYLFRIYRS